MLFGGRRTQLAIPNPCREIWDAIAGGNAERYCTACHRSVYDLSGLTRRQVAKLLDNNGGKVCGRIVHDVRGNQVFAKERNPIERLVQISVLGASVATSAIAAPGCELKVRVVDPAGTPIPKAIVNISSAADSKAVNGASNDQGEFSERIAPGTYSLRVEAPGFASLKQELTCNTSETISVDAPLRLGLVGEVVEVKPGHASVLKKLRSLFLRG